MRFAPIIASDASQLLGGGIMLAIMAGLAVLSIVWIIFPFIVMSGINALRAQNKAIIELQRALLEHAAAERAAAEKQNDLLGTQTEILSTHGAVAQRVRGESAAHLLKLGTSAEYTNALLKWIGEQKAPTPEA